MGQGQSDICNVSTTRDKSSSPRSDAHALSKADDVIRHIGGILRSRQHYRFGLSARRVARVMYDLDRQQTGVIELRKFMSALQRLNFGLSIDELSQVARCFQVSEGAGVQYPNFLRLIDQLRRVSRSTSSATTTTAALSHELHHRLLREVRAPNGRLLPYSTRNILLVQ